ncbi:hypothetical protein [Patulibacter defluvii]|uniref:hypothetical protein n=1 Tax=Patulibacter defluvii TaxID=3095358 RepID=UPI002A762DF2|nr:hypothetical protein [Patulibacter sp. DM4]
MTGPEVNDETLIVLRDRSVTTAAPTVDRLVVGPAGIVVLDGRGYAGRLRGHRWRPWLSASERARMTGGLLCQVDAVRGTLDGLGLDDVPVRGVLLGRPWGRRVRRRLRRWTSGPPVLDADEVRQVALILGV